MPIKGITIERGKSFPLSAGIYQSTRFRKADSQQPFSNYHLTMLNSIIQLALRYRLLVLAAALAVMVVGAIVAESLPIDVLPDLTRPRVVLLTECPGMAPEEVESLVTFRLEKALNGANGVIAVRSSSDIGLSLIYVEFDWGADIFTSRQIVQERIATVQDRLPEGLQPQIGPISSLLGQIMIIGMWSETGETSPLELRTIADWELRTRLLTLPGVSQVINMGGGRKQYQVLVDAHALHTHEVALHDIEQALIDSNLNVTGGYVDQASQELLVRGLGRLGSLKDIENVVVSNTKPRPLLVKHIAEVREGAQVKRGDASLNGQPAVVLTIQKQPGADTREVTRQIIEAVDGLRKSLPADVAVDPGAYQQCEFIDYGVTNVMEALRDGAVLVVVVLFLFLVNFRTTFITLTAIPLSILVTALVFRWMNLSINVMTLGGIAVALGELVDDAIVDVENILRRLRENACSPAPRSVMRVVYEASSEVRGAILISTVLVVVVFGPLFALSGMEGRLFTPLGIAYVVSILASTVVSLTVTPVLSYYLLPKARITQSGDGWLLSRLKSLAAILVRGSMTRAGLALTGSATVALLLASVAIVWGMGKNFLPPFNEGAAQVNLFARPGTSLEASKRMSQVADERFRELLVNDEQPTALLQSFVKRTGRAELDEHVMGVNVTEYVMTLNPGCGMNREELIAYLREIVDDIPGLEQEVEQPIAHMISHMLSGVTAQIAIKLFGEDLSVLRNKALEIKQAIAKVPGLAEPFVEQQQNIPQLRIELLRDRLAFYGLSARYVHEFVETAMNGRVVSVVTQGERTFDLLLRMNDEFREGTTNLGRTQIELPGGGRIPLESVARVYLGAGPNTIAREDARRRIVVRVNTTTSDLSTAVTEIKRRIDEEVKLPSGYFVELGGQFEAQQQSTRTILWLSAVAVGVVFVVLYSNFQSASLVWQILVALPVALIGGVWALVLTEQSLSVAGMVGFISLGGIAARNGLLLVQTYLDLGREQGFSKQSILQGSLERVAPVLMTSLTTGLGLLPLVVGGALPGKEILYPVATVILGGLVTSTLCEFVLRPGMFWFFTPGWLFEKSSVQETLVA